MLARELADEIQREKPHLPRAVAAGAARNAIRARYAAAAERHSVRAEREARWGFLSPEEAARRRDLLDRQMTRKGYTERVWHGTNGDDFNVFKFSANSHDVEAAYFTYSHGTAQNYAALRAMDYDDEGRPNTREFYVNPGKVLDIDETESQTTLEDFVAKLGEAYEQGYNAVRVKGALDDQGFRFKGDETMANMVAPETDGDLQTDILVLLKQPGDDAAARIKAADLATYDEDGNEIPLASRPNASSRDIRHSVAVMRVMRDIADGKGAGIIHNREYGDIEYSLGRLGKRGMGLAHIVESRMAKDGDTLDGAIDVAIKVAEAAADGVVMQERYNTKHFDLDGVRAIVAFNADGNKVITGYEISADAVGGANRRSPSQKSHPHVSLDEIVAALKSRLASLPGSTPRSIAYAGGGAQAESDRPEERHSLFVHVGGPRRLRKLAEAKRMLDENYDGEYTPRARELIYVATGWWRGADGKWRVEIANPTAKRRRGATKTLPDGTRMVNGLVPVKGGTVYGCRLPDICDLPEELVRNFPQTKGVNVLVVSPDTGKMRGVAAFWNREANAITISWDDVKWHADEPTNVLTYEGVADITHELQHAIQDWSRFAGGASWTSHGEENYERSAGEVEARNAELRRTDTTDENGDASAYADLVATLTIGGEEDVEGERETRMNAVLDSNAPWDTEDVPTEQQVFTMWDEERGAYTTDRRGRLVPRHSVAAGRGGGMRRQDMAVAFLAQRVLAGREATVDEAAAVLKSLGLAAVPAGETLAKAKKVAEDNRARLKKETEERSPKVFATLAAANLAEDMGVALDRLITRSSEAVDPEVGRRVQQAAHDHEARALAAANGFTAAEMAAEMPIDLAAGLLAVKEYEKTPEEKARLEAERARREEERRRRMEEDERTDEELLADAEADHLREPTAEERAAFDALMDRARFAEEQRKAEEQRRKLADAQRKRGMADGEDGADGDGADGADADALGEGTLSKETVARIAPVFESAELFAQFLVEWTGDKTLEKHPELPATAQMWKSPVAVRELKQTASAILRDLARRALGTPTHNHARNYADHLVNELESDAQIKTYASVRRMVARVYGVIHDAALRLTRRQLVDRLVNGWREGGETHMGIKQLAGVKGRFSATAEAAQRAIDGRTEQWARTLVKVIYLSEAKTAQREQELEAIVNFDPTAEDAGDAPTPDAVREAADELAIIRRYGGLRRMMPGQISELSDEILGLLNGKRQAFEAERLERERRCAAVREAFVAAVSAGRAPKPKGKKNFLVRWLEAFQGNVDLEMRSLYRHCADEAKRQAASDAVDELMVAISEAGSVYRVEAARGRAEVQRGLAAAYGSAEAGIKHLAEPLPAEVADAVFSQSRDLVPSYGHLLQLYASAIQKDYAENVKKHGRDRQLALMRSTLTAGDMAFHAWAAKWYAAGRARLSDAVEAVTGVPVTSPDNCYVPVRVKRPAQGFAAEVSAWSPIPRALSKRVPHALDFDEGADFLSLLLEQVETRAQTIGKAGLGIELRDTLAHRDVQDAVRRSVGADEMRRVADHLRDIVMEDAGRDRDRTLDLLDLARGWVARFGISGNLKSVMAQPASIPVWANVMLGGRSIGLGRVVHYLAHVDRDAIAELVESDGCAARYEMGWSEEVQNILKNPSRSRVVRSVERVYDLGMKPSQYADRCATLWVAQGFYRDARQRFLDIGETEAEAKRKALALTWAAVEATQQTGRTEYMNRAQRGRSGSIARAVFQFRTAQLLSNNYLIQALRDAKAGTPGAKGRLARAAVISTVIVPAYMMAVNALWDALMGEEPPEDEEKWPTLMKEMAWSMVDGVTAPLFVANTLAESTVKPLLGVGGFGSGSGIPALDSTKRLAVHLGKAAKDAAAWLGQNLGAFELEEEMTLDKIMSDLGRLAQDAAAPVRQTARALRNWLGKEK